MTQGRKRARRLSLNTNDLSVAALKEILAVIDKERERSDRDRLADLELLINRTYLVVCIKERGGEAQ